jgi:hypothetical protein
MVKQLFIVAGCIISWFLGCNVPQWAVFPLAFGISGIAVFVCIVTIVTDEAADATKPVQHEQGTRAWSGQGQGAVLQEVTG